MMGSVDASGMEVAGSSEPATQEENASIVDKVRGILEKHGYDTEGMTEEQAIGIFNELLEEQGKPYWLCPDCGRFHPREWTHCDAPSTVYEHSRDITEEEWDMIYDLYDPSDYAMDNAFLRFPHTRLQRWMDEAEDVYNILKDNLMNLKLVRACELWGVEEIVINDTQCEVTPFELALRRFEIQRFRGVKTTFTDLNSLLDYYIENAPSH